MEENFPSTYFNSFLGRSSSSRGIRIHKNTFRTCCQERERRVERKGREKREEKEIHTAVEKPWRRKYEDSSWWWSYSTYLPHIPLSLSLPFHCLSLYSHSLLLLRYLLLSISFWNLKQWLQYHGFVSCNTFIRVLLKNADIFIFAYWVICSREKARERERERGREREREEKEKGIEFRFAWGSCSGYKLWSLSTRTKDFYALR